MGEVKDLELAKAERTEWSKDITPEQCLKLALKDIADPKLDLKVTSIIVIALSEGDDDECGELSRWRSNLSVEKEIALLQSCVHQGCRAWLGEESD